MSYYYFTNDVTNCLTYECEATDNDDAWLKLKHAIDRAEDVGLRLPHGRWVLRKPAYDCRQGLPNG